jgi:hypothetical protein
MRLNIGLASSKPFNQLPLSLRLRSPQGESNHHKTLKKHYFGALGLRIVQWPLFRRPHYHAGKNIVKPMLPPG